MNSDTVRIAGRFCGPPNSGNGGYVCGLLASRLAGAVAVRLKAPPPLDTPLRREWSGESARLLHGDEAIAEARLAELDLQAPACPGLAAAERAAAGYPGFRQHVFPRCFVCGPRREAGDGLRIFAGPVEGQALHAAPWTPHASLADARGDVAPEFIWSALDCPSGFAVLPVADGMAIVLGELCVSTLRRLPAGRPVVVTSWPIAQEGRRRTAGSAIHTAQGDRVAIARAVWIEVPARRWAPAA